MSPPGQVLQLGCGCSSWALIHQGCSPCHERWQGPQPVLPALSASFLSCWLQLLNYAEKRLYCQKQTHLECLQLHCGGVWLLEGEPAGVLSAVLILACPVTTINAGLDKVAEILDGLTRDDMCSLPQVVLTDGSSDHLLQVGADQDKVDSPTIRGSSA